MTDEDKDTSVRVAVRIRPQIPRELIDMCRICTEVTPGAPQIMLGSDKAFTFDYVFDLISEQVEIYTTCVEKLIDGSLKGYNATVLAYGQTGSGKTYTMGTGFDRDIPEDLEGIIPRAVRHLFYGIQNLQENPYDEDGQFMGAIQFSVAAQFMELYNEDVIDLLDPYSKGRMYKIHEDVTGGISVSGATIRPLTGPQDALRCLQQGALARTTAATNMNEQSSRSHALFTILIRRQRVMSPEECGNPEGDLETLTSKFHFVDLAGSERLKRTGATGDRAREGISINCGLLALGNVISALGDKSKKSTHIPYRDSKLTRLLQDSLGGNSQTVMIACISPSDRDFMETLNSLKYANRARNIKNKIQINQDQSSRTISSLRREIAALQLELLEYKQGKRGVDEDGNPMVSDTSLENAMLLADNKRLQQRIKAMQETINSMVERNSALLAEKAISGCISGDSEDKSLQELVGNYLSEIEGLKAKLIESEQMFHNLKKSVSSPQKNQKYMSLVEETPDKIINMAKRELERDREILMSRSLPGLQTENSDNSIPNNNEDNESDSESDTESDDKGGELLQEINDITSDIELKSKLIEQLELSQQRMFVMKQHYEEKLNVLSAKIANTQKERDQVLANLGGNLGGGGGGGGGGGSNQPADKVKKVRDEYERKLTDLQKELRKLQSAQKEHLRQQRELQTQDAQLKQLRSDLGDLKSNKIRLMRKMQEESNRHKEEENRKMREIAQLRKEARKQMNVIKSLQAQGAAKDQVLKRKTEEVSALRKTQRGKMSSKAQGKVQPGKAAIINASRQSRLRWESLQRTITRAARSKQAVLELERELERLLNDREMICRDLSSIKRRISVRETPELISEQDTLEANLNYIQENITEIQHSIMELEEGKQTTTEQLALQTILENVRTVDEAKFLLEKLCGASISQVCDVELSQSRLKEKEVLLNTVQQDSNMHQELLQHVLARNPSLGVTDVNLPNPQHSTSSLTAMANLLSSTLAASNSVTGDNNNLNVNRSSTSSSRSPSPSTVDQDFGTATTLKSNKIRRRTALPKDLLFGDSNVPANQDDAMTKSFSQHEGRSMIPLARVPSAPGSLKGLLPAPLLTRQNSTASPLFPKKSLDTPTAPVSPRIARRNPFPTKASPGIDDIEIPNSPPVYRRATSREETAGDVFARLGAGLQDPAPGGNIREFNGKMKAGSPLHCTHVVEGHNNSVLSIKVCENVLFTAAADRTVKVWDLRTGTSSHTLASHPGPVVSVEFDLATNLLFSASGPFIRAWDLRESNIKPVKTLCSSGNTLSGVAALSSLVPGESPITALTIGSSGNLYTAASDKVRFWDLRMYSCLGKLSGGHSAAVMCVTAWEGPGNTDLVATGSKDHYVKVFEVPTTGGLVLPLLHLEPPHYDGVQALAVAKDAVGVDAELFSGSRDSGIKRWDLRNGELKQSLNNAHKGWVSGMAIYGDVLLSSCRGGVIRLWNIKTCDALAELKTDTSINDIVTNDTRVFTASNDGKVRLWRLSSAIRRLSQENNR